MITIIQFNSVDNIHEDISMDLMTTDLAQKRRVPATLLTLLLATLVVCFAGLGTRTLFAMKRDQLQIAKQYQENLALAIDADIERNIELYDLSLRNVISHYPSPDVRRLDKALRQLVLFDHAATARHFGPLRVFSDAGDLVLDASSLDPIPLNVQQSRFFQNARLAKSDALLIDVPESDPRGVYELVVSRKIIASDGSFLGVVAGSIKLSFFHDLFRRLELEDDASITLVNNAGRLVMRRPFDLPMLGKDLSDTKGVIKAHSAGELTGSFVGSRAVDMIERLYVWKRGEHFTIVVGRSFEDIFGVWSREAKSIVIAMGGLCLATVLVTGVLLFEIRSRRALQQKLAQIATIDGLTGIANRRRFDEVISTELRRAARSRSTLSLLLIDADNFKVYNDKFGHQEGDRALKNIADCIAAAARRVEDCPARYGGEEFALILPNTDQRDAMKIAERIRLSVKELPSNRERMSVSIGFASRQPNRLSTVADLIAEADEALYKAKRDGRDRTVSIVTSRAA
jgi:diguanylate cyclase (GGDEF)-like protein